MNIYTSVEQLVGRTPMLELSRLEKELNLKARLTVKLESKNPAGSAKDRVALEILNAAAEKGLLTKDTTVIEPTSGNTGIGLAAICAARGIKLIIVMPDSMSIERQKLMLAYGAELVLTPGAQGMAGAIAKADELKASIPGSIIAGQFTNPANPAAHYKTTGPEIWQDTDGKIDIFVAGVGTGGTISGTGRFLKEQNPAVEVVGVEPATSAVISGKPAGKHGLQGIGAGFIPEILDLKVIDRVIPVTDDEAFALCRKLATLEGLLIGISGGAALHAGIQLAEKEENAGKLITVLLPDSGERYLSANLF